MTNPPRPADTDREQHAPGVSKTLEENAEESRRRQERLRREQLPEREPAEGDAAEERRRV